MQVFPMHDTGTKYVFSRTTKWTTKCIVDPWHVLCNKFSLARSHDICSLIFYVCCLFTKSVVLKLAAAVCYQSCCLLSK